MLLYSVEPPTEIATLHVSRSVGRLTVILEEVTLTEAEPVPPLLPPLLSSPLLSLPLFGWSSVVVDSLAMVIPTLVPFATSVPYGHWAMALLLWGEHQPTTDLQKFPIILLAIPFY